MALSWRKVVEIALSNIGGEGSLMRIYDAVEANTTKELPPSWKAIVRRELEYNSSDSQSYKGRFDLFYSVEGIGSGIWGLRSLLANNLTATDILHPIRTDVIVSRIVRDTKMSRRVKRLHGNQCQLCDVKLTLPNGNLYSEAHHIQPLGPPHNGPDLAQNIIVVCPNHHALLDYCAIHLEIDSIRDSQIHQIGLEYIEYHNKRLFAPSTMPVISIARER